MKIIDILPWEDKGIGPTPLGTRHNFEAKPTQNFWKLWKSHRAWLQERGVRVRTNDAGWMVNFYREIEETTFTKSRREASRSHASEFRFPVPNGVTPWPYQRAGVEYLVGHADHAALLGDAPGLGKTAQAIWACNIWKPTKVLIVCPASLLRNWEMEWRKFSTLHLKVNRVEQNGDFPREPNVVICSLDSTYRPWLAPMLHAHQWDVVIVDEAHKLKNEKTNRSRGVFGGAGVRTSKENPPVPALRKIAITGTPIPSRTEELWNIARWLWPNEFGDFHSFAKRYCAASHSFGRLDTKGSSNEAELQAKLRSIGMIRRLKEDVLKDLPEKVRQIIELPGSVDIELNKATMEFEVAEKTIEEFKAAKDLADAAGDDEAFKLASAKLKASRSVAFEMMAIMQRIAAEQKAPLVVHHVKELLEGGLKKVVIGVHHKCLADACMEGLKKFNPVKITGSCSKTSRHAAVTAFQTDPGTRVLVGNLQAAGVGLTLTAADWMVLAEGSWVPADTLQFEDRIHRIGATSSSCTYQYLVLEGSLDAKKMQTCIRKLESQRAVLDDPEGDCDPIEEFSSSRISSQGEEMDEGKVVTDYRAIGKKLPFEQVDAIHAALKQIAKLDKDRASQANGVGFSRYDSIVGNSLADSQRLTPAQAALGLKIVTKYAKQLDPQLYARATTAADAAPVA